MREAWPDVHSDTPATLPDEVSYSLEGFVINGNHAVKKSVLILFINGRCVDCPALKRNMEAVYQSLIAKSFKMWAFLDIRMPAAHLDVNIHPTKSEVAFLHQVELVDGVRAVLQELLLNSNNTRTFKKGASAIVKNVASTGVCVCVRCLWMASNITTPLLYLRVIYGSDTHTTRRLRPGCIAQSCA